MHQWRITSEGCFGCQMSADNIIYVKKEGDQWLVWEDVLSNMDPRPPENAYPFNDLDSAKAYAFCQEDDHFVEYGVSVYSEDGKTIKEQNASLSDCQGMDP